MTRTLRSTCLFIEKLFLIAIYLYIVLVTVTVYPQFTPCSVWIHVLLKLSLRRTHCPAVRVWSADSFSLFIRSGLLLSWGRALLKVTPVNDSLKLINFWLLSGPSSALVYGLSLVVVSREMCGPSHCSILLQSTSSRMCGLSSCRSWML